MTARLEPPAYYDDAHRQIWAQTIARLTAGGRIFRADPEVLGAYVEAVCSHRQASEILAKTNVMIIRGGKTVENPALAVQRHCAESMNRTSKALGLDRIPADPIAEAFPAGPIAEPADLSDQRRWCEEHGRLECRHRRQDGNPCHQYRLVAGMDVCRKHGGKPLEELRAEGRARVIEREAARELYQRDARPVTNPLEALTQLAGRAAAWEEEIGRRVNELRSMRYEGIGGEQLRAEIVVMERAFDRLGHLLIAIAKLNIEERMAGIRKQTADMLERALDQALTVSGLDLQAQAAAREEFRRNLRVVA